MSDPAAPPPPTPSTPAAKVISRSRAVWLGDKRFAAGPEGRTHLIDGSAKEAPGPVETLLNALATCSAMDVLDIMTKRRTPAETLTVEITGERRPTLPRRLMAVEVRFVLDGAGMEIEQALRAAQLSLEKFCSVGSSLGTDIVMTTRVVVNGQESEPVRVALSG
jgi:putative redox protein